MFVKTRILWLLFSLIFVAVIVFRSNLGLERKLYRLEKKVGRRGGGGEREGEENERNGGYPEKKGNKKQKQSEIWIFAFFVEISKEFFLLLQKKYFFLGFLFFLLIRYSLFTVTIFANRWLWWCYNATNDGYWWCCYFCWWSLWLWWWRR